MKSKLFVLLLCILICFSACSKSGIKAGKPLSFDGLEVYSGGSANYMPYDSLKSIKKDYRLDQTVVFRGKKAGLSTPIQEYNKDGSKGLSYCETDLQVLEVFYGDIQVNDIISHQEWISVVNQDGIVYLQSTDATPPIAENEEYIFILSKNAEKNRSGKDFYGTYSLHHSYHKLADYETFKAKVQNGTATMRERFGYEVLNYYYLNQPDTAIDLHLEASKYVDGLSENATEEEILQSLPNEQKILFNKMIERYGTK